MKQGIVALIPAYKPDKKLIKLCESLLDSDKFCKIVCIDDGSGTEFDWIFKQLTSIDIVVKKHAVNLGKGAALKSGINYVSVTCPDIIGVVTLDADGQHLVKDVLAVAEELEKHPDKLVMGVRQFHDANIPLRSRFGNLMTKFMMRVFARISVSDTQTGLRGIPSLLFLKLLKLKTTGYDFELDMLMRAKEHDISFIEKSITTVYENNNASSHFNPFYDSLRIYMVFLRFHISAVTSSLIDYFLFFLSISLFNSVIVGQLLGRIIGGTFNFYVNKNYVFLSKKSYKKTLILYILNVIFSGTLSYFLIVGLNNSCTINLYAIKLMVESFLFVINFVIQREIVFK